MEERKKKKRKKKKTSCRCHVKHKQPPHTTSNGSPRQDASRDTKEDLI